MQLSPMTTLRQPETLANPYSYYDVLRKAGAAIRDPSGAWIVPRYADIIDLMTGPDWVADRLPQIRRLRPDSEHPDIRELYDTAALQLVYLDPPLHGRIRSLVSKAFTPSFVQRMSAAIQRFVDGLLDEALRRGQFDVIADLGVPLPMTVICEMLGIPQADRAQLKRWSEDYAMFLGGTLALSHETMLQIARSMREYTAYFQQLSERRRADPGDDLVSALLRAEDEGQTLSREHLCATCVVLVVAGHETTTNLIGNGLFALLNAPAQLERLRSSPQLWPSAIEELLRFDSPVQYAPRCARNDTTIGGERIAAGDIVYAVLGSGNRDPARFEDPDRLDVERPNNRHLSFAHGAHYCIGASLARLETKIALSTLFARTRTIRLLEPAPKWRPNAGLRGLEALPVETC